MNKRNAIQRFMNTFYDEVIREYGQSDKIAMIISWDDFTDDLCKSGEITEKQYANWSNPFEFRK